MTDRPIEMTDRDDRSRRSIETDRSIGEGARGARDARVISRPTDGDSRTVPPPGPDRDGGVILFGAARA